MQRDVPYGNWKSLSSNPSENWLQDLHTWPFNFICNSTWCAQCYTIMLKNVTVINGISVQMCVQAVHNSEVCTHRNLHGRNWDESKRRNDKKVK